MTITWTPSSQIVLATAPQPAGTADGPIRFGVHVSAPWGNPVVPIENAWNTVDMTQWGVPANAIAVLLTGILIITHGEVAEEASMSMGFRACGDTTAIAPTPGGPGQAVQVIEGLVGGGQRCTSSIWIPLNQGKFDFYFVTTSGGIYPANSAYAAEYYPQAYALP